MSGSNSDYEWGWRDCLEYQRDHRRLYNNGRLGIPLIKLGVIWMGVWVAAIIALVNSGDIQWAIAFGFLIMSCAMLGAGVFLNDREKKAFQERKAEFDLKYSHVPKNLLQQTG